MEPPAKGVSVPENNISKIDGCSELTSTHLDRRADRFDVQKVIGRVSFVTDDFNFIMMSDFEQDNELRAMMSSKTA